MHLIDDVAIETMETSPEEAMNDDPFHQYFVETYLNDNEATFPQKMWNHYDSW